ncbi:MAG: hypothetical protein AB7I48_14820 [Planctomycetaceae bacterium]
MAEPPKSRTLKLDDTAASKSLELPAFLSRPEGAPVYHGFPIVKETMTDGWCYGAITEYAYADGCDSGDAFIIAPDGSRAGLVWEVGEGEPTEICAPDAGRWGVYQIWFPRVVRTNDDLLPASGKCCHSCRGFMIESNTVRPDHALQRTRPSRSGCNPRVPRAGSLSLGRFHHDSRQQHATTNSLAALTACA